MKRYLLKLLFLLLAIGLFGYVMLLRLSLNDNAAEYNERMHRSDAEVTAIPAAVMLEPSPDPTPLATATPEPTPSPEPTPELMQLSFIGDLTLTSYQGSTDFERKMDGDTSYPLSNVSSYFENDEYTIGNLECTFSDRNLYSDTTFHFLGPSSSANILTDGGVDFVTTANNHTEDYGQAGKEDTWAALEAVGLPFGKNDEAQIVTTPNGLRLGIYCQYDPSYYPNETKAVAAIETLKEEEPDLIICAFHMGVELMYRPIERCREICRSCIDAGADIVYGSHPHCLQPVEEYEGGLILYSMGNFCFGGHTAPTDRDTAIVQVTVKRDLDGAVSLSGLTLIPCCVSSRPVLEGYTGYEYNDYRPTPYIEGTEDYLRTLSKLTGEYDGPDGNPNYEAWHAQHG